MFWNSKKVYNVALCQLLCSSRQYWASRTGCEAANWIQGIVCPGHSMMRNTSKASKLWDIRRGCETKWGSSCSISQVCAKERKFIYFVMEIENLEIEVMSRSSTCLESRADYYNRSWKWANMPFFKDTYFLLRKVFKVSIGQKVQQFAELPSDWPVQHFLSDPCAHGVRSLGRNVCPSVTEFVKT